MFTGKWRACIGHQGTEYSLGLYASEEEVPTQPPVDVSGDALRMRLLRHLVLLIVIFCARVSCIKG